jgi:hypothetical protein
MEEPHPALPEGEGINLGFPPRKGGSFHVFPSPRGRDKGRGSIQKKATNNEILVFLESGDLKSNACVFNPLKMFAFSRLYPFSEVRTVR